MDAHQTFFPNSPSDFGNQFVVDKDENIIDEIPYILINALNLSINQLSEKVYQLGGMFIPAHVDRNLYSLSSQLGIVPDNLDFNVLELSPYAYRNKFFEKFPWFADYSYITNSDAHFISDIGKSYNLLNLKKIDFFNIKEALRLAITKFPE
ncbi:MAG: hypothetical protein C0596_00785 [Marinilabiliales bacterium]|nr:MAG: hypothetical protein C0596_00785 [Marinilabiliales bacterium]